MILGKGIVGGDGEAWGGGQGWRSLNNGKWKAQIGPQRHCPGHGPAEKKEKILDRAGGLIRYAMLEADEKGREKGHQFPYLPLISPKSIKVIQGLVLFNHIWSRIVQWKFQNVEVCSEFESKHFLLFMHTFLLVFNY